MANILIVDDEQLILDMLRLWLEDAGHSVTDATDGNIALVKMKETKIDILVSDLFMPEKEGTELIMEVRNAYPETAIIAISGHQKGSVHLATAKKLGADHILSKPFDQHEFLQTITNQLS
ncbi:MAG: response regulator [Rhodospirillales bacterium]|nr:response regulator [Rhodospirillales bacterium]